MLKGKRNFVSVIDTTYYRCNSDKSDFALPVESDLRRWRNVTGIASRNEFASPIRITKKRREK